MNGYRSRKFHMTYNETRSKQAIGLVEDEQWKKHNLQSTNIL